MRAGSHGSLNGWVAACLSRPRVELYIAEADWDDVDELLDVCAAVEVENKVPGTMRVTADVHASLSLDFLKSVGMDIVPQPPYDSFDDPRLKQAAAEIQTRDPATGRYQTTAELATIRASRHAAAIV